MRSPSLTRQSRRENGTIVSTFSWRGQDVEVRDSAKTALLVSELLQDEGLSPWEKKTFIGVMLFPDIAVLKDLTLEEQDDLIAAMVWDAFGLDISAQHIHSSEYAEAVFDWIEDAGRIRASLLQCYGLNWDEVASITSYADMCSLLGTLLEADTKTPFQQAIYYRTAKTPKRTKHNGEMCDAFEARRKHFKLDAPATDDDGDSVNQIMADMFASAKRAAGGE